MSRAQLALNVDNLDEAVAFYSKLFNTPPAKVKPGYANFAVAEPPLKLVLIENPGHGGTLNHLGVEVEDSDAVHAEIARLTDEGMFTEEEIGTTCCFATQDKVWVTGPGGEKWEVYTVLADSETFGTAAAIPDGCSAPPATVSRFDAGRRRAAEPAVTARAPVRGGPTLVAEFAGSACSSPSWSAPASPPRHCRPRCRTAAAGELDGDGPRPRRADPAVRPGVRRALQSCCLAGGLAAGATIGRGIDGRTLLPLHRRAGAGRHRRGAVGQRRCSTARLIEIATREPRHRRPSRSVRSSPRQG